MVNPATVVFDVGGTLFKVAMSTIQKYPASMLARMVSEEWTDDGEGKTPMFIDGNPERFSLILDMMRHDKVVVPMGVPMSMVQTDAEYYGISLVGANGMPLISNDHLSKRADELRAKIVGHKEMADELKSEVDLIVFVGWCYHQVLASGQSRISSDLYNLPPGSPINSNDFLKAIGDRSQANDYMAAAGLKISINGRTLVIEVA